jgi:hypothetical protein
MNKKALGRRTRPSHRAAFKAKVALAALRGQVAGHQPGRGVLPARPTSEVDLALMRRMRSCCAGARQNKRAAGEIHPDRSCCGQGRHHVQPQLILR